MRISTASDTVAPSNETLGIVEFGEAGIDLTDAGVFTAGTGTCESFGTAYGVSRTWGSSVNAQMKDIVGPAPCRLANCGEIVIKKRTDPRGLNQAFSFTSNIGSSSSASCTKSTANSFS